MRLQSSRPVAISKSIRSARPLIGPAVFSLLKMKSKADDFDGDAGDEDDCYSF
jgi:hypothetical protein